MGLLNWFLKEKETIYGYTKAFWTGVSTITLAQAFEQAIEENLCGLYHLVNNHPISKFELLKLFNKYLKKEQIEILPNDLIHLDKSLVNHRKDFSFIVPSYEEMIKDTRKWILSHKELYPHYL